MMSFFFFFSAITCVLLSTTATVINDPDFRGIEAELGEKISMEMLKIRRHLYFRLRSQVAMEIEKFLDGQMKVLVENGTVEQLVTSSVTPYFDQLYHAAGELGMKLNVQEKEIQNVGSKGRSFEDMSNGVDWKSRASQIRSTSWDIQDVRRDVAVLQNEIGQADNGTRYLQKELSEIRESRSALDTSRKVARTITTDRTLLKLKMPLVNVALELHNLLVFEANSWLRSATPVVKFYANISLEESLRRVKSDLDGIGVVTHDFVEYNEGSGYGSKPGRFRAPVTGTYFLLAQLALASIIKDETIRVRMYKDGQIVEENRPVSTRRSLMNLYMSQIMQVIIYLKVDEEVWVETSGNEDVFQLPHISFGGLFVSADQIVL